RERGGGQRCARLTRGPSAGGDPEPEHDETELADLREPDRDLPIATGYGEEGVERGDDDCLQRDESDEHEEPSGLARDRCRIDERADRDEEEHREEIPEGKHLAARLLRDRSDREEDAGDERSERDRDPEDDRTYARDRERGGHGSDEERVGLILQGGEQPRDGPTLHAPRDDDEGDRLPDRAERRLATGREEHREQRRGHERDRVLQQGPHDERALGHGIGGALAAAGDVDDDDRR